MTQRTKEQELCELLDYVFADASRPDFSYVREVAFRSQNSSWLITELVKVMWLCNEDPAAFDEYIWRITNGA